MPMLTKMSDTAEVEKLHHASAPPCKWEAIGLILWGRSVRKGSSSHGGTIIEASRVSVER